MGRYLLYFSYIGTRYRGMQRQIIDDGKTISIQSVLEAALRNLRPQNEALITTSSRTDKGVHAFENTAHVDLVHVKENREYDEEFITNVTNNLLSKQGHEITINKVRRVNSNFHARHNAVRRNYLYRVGMVNKNAELRPLIPIAELNRCYFIKPPICEAKLKLASQMLNGVHDFSTFMCNVPGRVIYPYRLVHVSVSRGQGLFSISEPHLYKDITFFDFHFSSKSFLYKQVRKMVSVILSCGRGNLSISDVQRLLDEPNVDHWPSHVSFAPPHGLYLRSVDYNSTDLDFNDPGMHLLDN